MPDRCLHHHTSPYACACMDGCAWCRYDAECLDCGQLLVTPKAWHALSAKRQKALIARHSARVPPEVQAAADLKAQEEVVHTWITRWHKLSSANRAEILRRLRLVPAADLTAW